MIFLVDIWERIAESNCINKINISCCISTKIKEKQGLPNGSMTALYLFFQFDYRVIVIMSKSREPQFSPIITSQANTIYIDDQTQTQNGRYINSIASISRLPAFDKNDNLTNLLYSKFLVKGVKPINYEAILSKLKANGEVTSERKVTRETSNYTKEVTTNRKESQRGTSQHHRNSSEQGDIFDFSMVKWKETSQNNLTIGKRTRPQSGFERSSHKRTYNRPQSAFPQTASLKLLSRPQSATASKRPRSTSKQHQNARPQSSFDRTSVKKPSQYEYLPEKRSKILTISESNPNLKTVDYIQKNRREASLHKRSVYITATEGEKGAQNIKVLQKQTEEERVLKFEKKIESQRQVVTRKQKELISEKHKAYLLYMKENMPGQYQECIDFIARQNDLSQEETRSLLSCGLGEGQPLVMTQREVEEFQVQHFYSDFLNKCLNLEHNISAAKTTQQSIENSLNILTCHEVQKLKSIFQSIRSNKENNLSFDLLNDEVKNIVKSLHFFKELRREVLKSVFGMDYQIVEIQESQIVIDNLQQVEFVYVILSGSVTKKNHNEPEDTLIHDRLEPPEFLTTLFDGQIFGLPSKTQETQLHYSITTLEKTLLMLFPYSSYRKALSSNQNIEDRIELLKNVFPNPGGHSKLTKQDYESIAFQMQTLCFSSEEIVVREGQNRYELMIIGNGKLDICFESIIQRKKSKVNPLSKKREGPIRKIDITELRKKNMINYEVLFENEREIHYYFNRSAETKIRGDTVNWKGFSAGLQTQEDRKAPFKYSMISKQNNTKLYLLRSEKVEALSEHLRKVIKEFAEKNAPKESIERKEDHLKKWEDYKIRVCSDILKFKGKKLY